LVAIRNTEMRFELRAPGGLTAFVAALMVDGDVFALADELVDRPAWQADALCREHPEVEFFPRHDALSTSAARAVCRACLVRTECATFALERPDLHGVWGATTQTEREKARTAGFDVNQLLTGVDTLRKRAPEWQTAPCRGCSGLLSRRDVAIGDGWCWACRRCVRSGSDASRSVGDPRRSRLLCLPIGPRDRGGQVLRPVALLFAERPARIAVQRPGPNGPDSSCRQSQFPTLWCDTRRLDRDVPGFPLKVAPSSVRRVERHCDGLEGPKGDPTMRFQTYRRVKRGAITALVLVPIAALGAMFVPANAQDGKIKTPGLVLATWNASTSGVNTMPYRTVWDPTAQGINMPPGYHGAVVIQRLTFNGWKSGMMLTPTGARDLAVRILLQLHGASGSIQIWNHRNGQLNQTDMRFTAPTAYGLAYHLVVAADGH
jgi:Transcription factor WhiB